MKYKIDETQKEEGIIFYFFKGILGSANIKFDFLTGKHEWYPKINNLENFLITDNFYINGFLNVKKVLNILKNNPYKRSILFENLNNKYLNKFKKMGIKKIYNYYEYNR